MNKKTPKKLVFIPLLIALLICTSIPLSQGAVYVGAQFSISNTNSTVTLWGVHPSSNSQESAHGFTFTPTTTGYLKALSVGLMVEGTCDAVIRAKLVECADTLNHAPDGDLIELSSSSWDAQDFKVYIAGNLTRYQESLVQFDFAGTSLLQTGHNYAIVIYVESATTIDSGNKVYIATKATSGYAGYWSMWEDSAWDTVYTEPDICFIALVDTVPTPTPTPVPTAVPTPTNDYKWDENTDSWSWWNGTHWIPSSGPSPTANAQIVTFTGNMITYIVPLALLLLPAIVGAWALGRAGAAKWGFIAGLNIGAIMCYLYLPAFGLWAVIAIVMVDVLMIFASTRGGD